MQYNEENYTAVVRGVIVLKKLYIVAYFVLQLAVCYENWGYQRCLIMSGGVFTMAAVRRVNRLWVYTLLIMGCAALVGSGSTSTLQ